MVKKGKDKGGGATAGGSTARKAPAEDDFIVFTNSTKDSKPKKAGPSASAQPASSSAPGETPDGPPKPTVKQIIGGSSWTGKLPVNLLSEHCQKQKWERPEYDTVGGICVEPIPDRFEPTS